MANATLLFLATDDGLILLSDPADQRRWRRSAHQFQGSMVQSVWVNPSNPLVVLVIADGRTHRSVDGGQTWTVLTMGDLLAPDARLYASLRHSSLVCARSGNVLFTSDDAGASWNATVLSDASGAFAVDDAGRFYRTVGAQILASDDRGVTWNAYGPPLPETIHTLVTLPDRSGTLCALAGGRVYVIEHESWRLISGIPGEALACAVLAGRTPVVLAALAEGGAVRGTLDAWEPARVAFPWTGAATILKPTGYHIDTAFAASSTGEVAMSVDRGRSWLMVRHDLATIRDIVTARLA